MTNFDFFVFKVSLFIVKFCTGQLKHDSCF